MKVVLVFVLILSSPCLSLTDDARQGSDYDQTPSAEQADTNSKVVSIGEADAADRQNKESRHSETERTDWSVTDIINCISTGVIAVFTVVLAVYTVRLWSSGERHAERELRAYVYPIDLKLRNFISSDRISAFVTIKNSGQTPAYKFTCQAKMIAGPFPQTEFVIPEAEIDFAPAYVGPGVTISYTPVKDITLTHEDKRNIIQGQWAIYAFGRIDYVDAFKVPRWTSFRAFARGDQGRMFYKEGDKDVLLLETDKEGNDAT